MAFDALEMSLSVLDQLATVEPRLRQKRKSLADEIGRAAESIALNISEGRERAGFDLPDRFRRAAGCAAEKTTALRITAARGYIRMTHRPSTPNRSKRGVPSGPLTR